MLNHVAVVTGASSGIGRATALRLALEYPSMVLVGRDRARLDETRAQIRLELSDILLIEADLAEPAAAARVIDQTLNRFGRIDALVNIAGAVPGADLFGMTDAHWDAAMAVKLHGARRLTIRAWEALKASEGAVVFTSGVAAYAPTAAQAAIGVINAAVEAMMKAFAERGVTDAVRVNAVSPGSVMTERRLGLIQHYADAQGLGLEDAKWTLLKLAGIRRYGLPEEVAELFAFLLSQQNKWMSGSVLRLDGGEARSL